LHRSSSGDAVYYAFDSFYKLCFSEGSVRRICEAILRDSISVLTVSNLMHGQYGVDDVCLSLPFVIGAGGIKRELNVVLTEQEEQKLRHSADTLKSILRSIRF